MNKIKVISNVEKCSKYGTKEVERGQKISKKKEK